MEDIVSTKRALRKAMKAKLRAISEQEREQAAQKVLPLMRAFLASRRPQGPILAYWSMPEEFHTQGLVRALSLDYEVVLPVVRGAELELHRYTGDADMQAVPPYGILEPQAREVVAPDTVALAIIPGLAFDLSGGRMGHGKGYYDRLLPRMANARLVGLAFACQVVPTVPREAHDVQLDALLTEQGWLRGAPGC